MLCHSCKTEMQQTELKTLTDEQLDKILDYFDKEKFFPKIISYVRDNRGLKITLLKKGYIFYLCPKDKHFTFIKKDLNYIKKGDKN